MNRLLACTLLLIASVAWADPADDLRACLARTQQAESAKTAYVAKLAEMLAETREQLDQARQQLTALAQELGRLKAVKPEEKK